jgi:WD40 repeat protein
MDVIYEQLRERNSRETTPFVSIYEAYTSLLNLTDVLQHKYSVSEKELERFRQQLHDTDGSRTGNGTSGPVKGTSTSVSNTSSNMAIQSAMKNETRLREQVEALQEQYNRKVDEESTTISTLKESQTLNTKNEANITDLKDQLEQMKNVTEHLRQQVTDAESNSILIDEQNFKLKVAFRSLQEENDKLKQENSILEGRLVAEKGKVVDEMNELTDMIDQLKVEVELLRAERKQNNQQETKLEPSSSPSRLLVGSIVESGTPASGPIDGTTTEARPFDAAMNVPTTIHKTISAHIMEGTCVRFDQSGVSGMKNVVTASTDGTIKVWGGTETADQQPRYLFRGTPGYSMLSCDIAGTLIVGGGNDKSCRVWDLRNERMVGLS